MEEVILEFYFLELGMTWRREGRIARSGFPCLLARIFIDYLEISSACSYWPDLSF
jgi:hypothetical protein